jgi:hypothetical protein
VTVPNVLLGKGTEMYDYDAWFVNEDGGTYQYDRRYQAQDFPMDYPIPYETQTEALEAADELSYPLEYFTD